MSDDMGFAAIYETPAAREQPQSVLEDVKGNDWRNILVLGRATHDGVYPETLALLGRARSLADELGCRVEVLLIGEQLDAATEALRKYPIDTVYRVKAPDYAAIDHTARILEQVVRKRRPELVLVFQSRTGDAVTAYASNRLGVGFVTGASRIELDTSERRAVVTHESTAIHRFQVVSAMEARPQFVTVQRGMFRAPLEDPYANVRVHDLKVEAGKVASIKVLGKQPAPAPTLETAERVVVAGARIQGQAELDLARELADRLDAVFAVTTGIVERGLAPAGTPVVGVLDRKIAPRLLVTVGVRGALDLLEGIQGNPLVCAIGCDAGDPIAKRASYMVPGEVRPGVEAVMAAL